jgi:hypothetical protein
MPESGSVTVWVKVVNQYGCVDSTSTVIEAIPCAASISSPTNGSQTLCETAAIDPISFTATGITNIVSGGFPNGLTVAWSGGVVSVSGTPTQTGVFPYSIIATGLFGSASATGTLTVNPKPAVPTMGGGGTQCGGTKSITATAGANGNGIRWTDNSSTVSPRNAGSGTYYAVTTAAYGCESSVASVTVTINPVPSVPTMGGGGGPYCGSTTISATAGANGNGIRWTDNNTTVSPRSVNSSGTYYAVSTSTAGCVSSSASVTVTMTPNCANWTTCSGFTQVSNVSYEASLAHAAAATFCQNKGTGWRLPTLSELQCLCSNKATLPGGYNVYRYWSSTLYTGVMYYAVKFDACRIENNNSPLNAHEVKCVK